MTVMPNNLIGAQSAASPIASDGDGVCFGPFRLSLARHALFEGEKLVRIGSRALDLLIALVERRGELVGKGELIARVWPDTFVEEGNLRVHLAVLRKALGDGRDGARYIVNVPGRGYSFVAPVSLPTDAATSPPADGGAVRHGLPTPHLRMVGRDETLRSIVAQLPSRRFITLVGPGGIGKTTVALAVADALAGSYRDGIRFIDLASLADQRLVPSAVASVLGLAIISNDPMPGLAAFLGDREMLLVIDNCEHVIEAAAALAETISQNAPGVLILATSREPLRATGERVFRLGPLELPPDAAGLTAAEALRFPAVQLFVERAAASDDAFALTDADAPIAAEICRRLDGVALAIELAAGRVDVFGVRGLAERLDDRFRILTHGRRTALPRQKTLAATLDWSFQLLPENERIVLTRLSVFAGAMTLESAAAVAVSEDIAGPDVVEAIADLVAKSLVSADLGGKAMQYRLLDITRAYALEKLTASGGFAAVARRHADFYLARFQQAESEAATRPTTEWLDEYGGEIDDLRGALGWAFSPNGDDTLGVALTVAAVPLWMHLSMVEECRRRVERALAAVDALPQIDPRLVMKLNTALGSALLNQKGSGPDVVSAWRTALAIAEQLDDTEYRLRALWGLWADQYYGGDLRAALAIVEQYRSLAPKSSDPADVLVGDRIYGVALHCLGDQPAARRLIKGVVANYVTPANRSHIIRYQYDQGVSARGTLSLIQWIQGFPDQAMRTVEDNVAAALRIDHTLSLCSALANTACPLALNIGSLDSAKRHVGMLLDQTYRHGIAVWHAWGRCFQGILQIKEGDAVRGLASLREALDAFPDAGGFALRYSAFRTELAEALGRGGETAKALAAMDEAIARSERFDERWCFAEMLRVKGELILMDAPQAMVAAEDHFLRAIDWARRQEALAWELRAATSLARLRRRQGLAGEGRDLLAAVYGRLSEGFETADARSAKGLLDELDEGLA